MTLSSESLVSVLRYSVLPTWVESETYPTMPVHRLLLIVSSALFWEWWFEFVCAKKLRLTHRQCVRMTSMLHAVVATVGAGYLMLWVQPIWQTPESYCVEIRGGEVVFPISYGFFVWDAYKLLQSEFSLDFAAHVSLSLAFYTVMILSPMGHRAMAGTLLFEASTIFLHAYALLHNFGYEQTAAYLRLLFALSFFLVRIVFGIWFSVECWGATLEFANCTIDVSCVPTPVRYFCVFVSGLFNVLHIYWFALIANKFVGQLLSGKLVKKMDSAKVDDFDKYRTEQREHYFGRRKEE